MLASDGDTHLNSMCVIAYCLTASTSKQFRAIETTCHVNKATSPRIIPYSHTQRAMIAVLNQATRHRNRLLYFTLIIKVQSRKRQQQGMQTTRFIHSLIDARIQQSQLPSRMSEGCGNLIARFIEVGLVIVIAKLFFLLQHSQC